MDQARLGDALALQPADEGIRVRIARHLGGQARRLERDDLVGAGVDEMDSRVAASRVYGFTILATRRGRSDRCAILGPAR